MRVTPMKLAKLQSSAVEASCGNTADAAQVQQRNRTQRNRTQRNTADAAQVQWRSDEVPTLVHRQPGGSRGVLLQHMLLTSYDAKKRAAL
jgi:hypothetical protein